MRKKIFAVLFIFLSFSIYAGNPFQIELPENQKLESSFSIDVSNNKSLHLLMVKNKDTKKWNYRVFFVESDLKTRELETVDFNNMPSILTFHGDEKQTTFTLYCEKSRELTFLDINHQTGKQQILVLPNQDKPEIAIHDRQKSVLVNAISGGLNFQIFNIQNSNQFKKSEFSLSGSALINEVSQIFEVDPQAINQNEYVKSGSIAPQKVYLSDNKLYLTKEYLKQRETRVYMIDLENPTSLVEVYKPSDDYRFLDFNSYISDNHLFVVGTAQPNAFHSEQNRNDVMISIADLSQKSLLKKFWLSEDVFKNTADEKYKSFLDQNGENNYKVTITVNKTKNNYLKFRIGRENKFEYNYYYDWWFHHQFIMMNQQMLMNQQMMNSVPRGFGPCADAYEYYSLKTKELASVEFTLDASMKLINDDSDTAYPKIDRDKYLEEFKENKKYKKFTACFMANEMRYIYQDNKTKTVYIESKAL